MKIDEYLINQEYVINHQWDTSGHNKFKSLRPKYYKNSQVFIIVFDKSSIESFNQVEVFYEEIKNFLTGNEILIIAGNKSDLDPQVSFEQAKEMADRFKAIYMDVCAKTGAGIEFLLEVSARQGLSRLRYRSRRKR